MGAEFIDECVLSSEPLYEDDLHDAVVIRDVNLLSRLRDLVSDTGLDAETVLRRALMEYRSRIRYEDLPTMEEEALLDWIARLRRDRDTIQGQLDQDAGRGWRKRDEWRARARTALRLALTDLERCEREHLRRIRLNARTPEQWARIAAAAEREAEAQTRAAEAKERQILAERERCEAAKESALAIQGLRTLEAGKAKSAKTKSILPSPQLQAPQLPPLPPLPSRTNDPEAYVEAVDRIAEAERVLNAERERALNLMAEIKTFNGQRIAVINLFNQLRNGSARSDRFGLATLLMQTVRLERAPFYFLWAAGEVLTREQKSAVWQKAVSIAPNDPCWADCPKIEDAPMPAMPDLGVPVMDLGAIFSVVEAGAAT